MSNLIENIRIANAYRSICEGVVPSTEETEREWEEWLADSRRASIGFKPEVETQEGLVRYEYDPTVDALVYRGKTDDGTVLGGMYKIDHRLTMSDNVSAAVYEIVHRYGG